MSIARQRRRPPSVGRSAPRTLLLATDLQQSVFSNLQVDGLNRSAFTPYGFQSSSQGARSQLGFNGQLREPTGWYHLGNGHRVYNPVLMRFHSSDKLSPFGAGGMNPYAYCSGSPVGRVDPSGKFSLPAIGNLVSFFLSGIFTGVALNRASAAIVSGVESSWLSRLATTAGFLGGGTTAISRLLIIPSTLVQPMPGSLVAASSLVAIGGQVLTGAGALILNLPIMQKWMTDAAANGQSRVRVLGAALKEASGWNFLRRQKPGVVPGRPPDIPLAQVSEAVPNSANAIRRGSATPPPS